MSSTTSARTTEDDVTQSADAATAEEEQDRSQEEEEREVRELPLDLTFEILKNERRRLVLDYLREVDGETTIGELAEHIAAIENDTTVQALGAQQRKRVYIGLYQCHLPKMDDAGVVSFNQSRGDVTLEPEATALFDYLAEGDDEEEPEENAAPTRYAAATLGMGAAFAVAQFLGLYAVATGVVFAFLAGVLVVSYRARVGDADADDTEDADDADAAE